MKPKATVEMIQELRSNGYKVFVDHIRHRDLHDKIDAKGGYTIVHVLDENKEVLAKGKASCSKVDNYNKKVGLAIALGRCIKNLEKYAHPA